MDRFLEEINNIGGIMLRGRAPKGGGGIHPGSGRGSSMEFHGHSPYHPGGDIRRVDWPAYARTENLYLRDFGEERQALVKVLLDSSASMDFGSPAKWNYALKLSLGLAYLALRQGDRLSFFTAGGGLETYKENVAGLEHFYELVKYAPRMNPRGVADGDAFVEAGSRRAGINFLVSDFLGLDAAAVLDRLCPEQPTALLQVLSPQELDPPVHRELKLLDAETGRIKRIEFTPAARRRYRERVRQFLTRTGELCARRGGVYVFASTATSPALIIRRVLEVGG